MQPLSVRVNKLIYSPQFTYCSSCKTEATAQQYVVWFPATRTSDSNAGTSFFDGDALNT